MKDDKIKIYEISNEESNCIYIVKLLFIILVVFLHSYTQNINFSDGKVLLELPVWFENVRYAISKVIALCAVPGFFLISSILLYRKEINWRENIIKKCKTLLIPYFVLNTLWLIFYAIAQNVSFLQVYFSSNEFNIYNWNFIDYIDAFIGFKTGYPILYTLWFLRDLFIMNVLSVFIKKIIDRFPKIVLALIMLLYFSPMKFLSIDTIVFFILGYYVVKYDFHLSQVKNIKSIYLLLPYFIGIILSVMFRENYYVYILQRIVSVLGIMIFIKIAFYLQKDWILDISKYSLFIYLFHENLLIISRKIMTRITPPMELCQQHYSITYCQ